MNRSQQLTADWVTPQEAADYLGVTTFTIRKYIKEDRLKAAKLGHRTVRISAASIEKFLESCQK